MRISRAEVRHLTAPVKGRVETSFGSMTGRHAVLLVLTDEDGRRGVGESWVNFPSWAPWERVAAFERAIIPHISGREVEDVAAFVGGLWRRFRGEAVQAGCAGTLLQALAAVELALWDLAAQGRGLPLSRMLFGRPHGRVRVYASGISAPIPWELVDELLARGVALFKLKLGFGDEADRRSVESLKERLGGRARLAVDVNRGWSFDQALGWLGFLRDLDVEWLEEPLRVEDEHRLSELRGRGVAIAGGENVLMPPGSDAARLAADGPDVLQPDLTKYAPLHVALGLLDAARGLGRRLVPHFLGSAPGQAASIHFAAGCPEGLVEWDINPNPLRTGLFTEPFEITDGSVTVPDGPGLGWRLKE